MLVGRAEGVGLGCSEFCDDGGKLLDGVFGGKAVGPFTPVIALVTWLGILDGRLDGELDGFTELVGMFVGVAEGLSVGT